MDLKYICTDCLSNKSLINYVKQNSTKKWKTCSICAKRKKQVIDISTLAEYMFSCISHNYSTLSSRDGIDYDPEKDCFYYIDTDCEVEFTNIFEILEDNQVLSGTICRDEREDIYESIFGCIYPKINIYEELAESGWAHAQSNDLFFTWETFNYLVQHNNRFFDYNNHKRYEYMNKILSFFDEFEEIIPSGTELYRVRNAEGISEEIFSNHLSGLKEISPPPCQYTKSYRMSPKGISYTYVSTDITTCLKECNLKSEDVILVGLFETNKELRILNLEIKDFPYNDLFSGNLDRERENINHFIESYCCEISKPVDTNNEYEYLSTQIIAEYIRFSGYDGIAYSSAKTSGTNYVFFYGPDYYKFPELRPRGWNCFIDSVPSFTEILNLKEYAFCQIVNSHSCEYQVVKSTDGFNL